MKRFQSMLISGALALSMVGCGEDVSTPAPPPAAAPKPAAQAPRPTPPAAVVPTYVYNYNPVGKRDPFRSLEEVLPEPPPRACNEMLCQWDVDQLKLVAVVMGDANPMAMVEDPAGRGHIVRRNSRMGRQGGRVTQILQNELVVSEAYDLRLSNPVKLHLKQDAPTSPDYDLITGKPWAP